MAITDSHQSSPLTYVANLHLVEAKIALNPARIDNTPRTEVDFEFLTVSHRQRSNASISPNADTQPADLRSSFYESSYGLLREPRSSKGHISLRVSPSSRNMQCSTGNVFQELQQQGTTSQEGESAAEGRAQAGGGRGGDRRVPPSPSLETSSSFFPEDSPHTQSPTPSFFREAAGSSRYQGSQDPRGRRGSLIDAQSTSEASRGSTTRIRPAAGSRPAGTPFGPSTGETVPSQLLGGRAGTDADVFVNSQLSNYALEYEAPKAMLRKTTATQQLRQISDHDNSVRYVRLRNASELR